MGDGACHRAHVSSTEMSQASCYNSRRPYSHFWRHKDRCQRISRKSRSSFRSSARLASQASRLWLQTVSGLRVSDTHGIKAWRRTERLLEQIEACRFTRDIFDTELVIRGERAGFRLLELPVTVAEQRAPRSWIFARV